MSILRNQKLSVSSLIAGIVLSTAFLLITAILTLVVMESRKTSLAAARTLFAEISDKTIANIGQFLDSISTMTNTASFVFAARPATSAHIDYSQDKSSLKGILDSNDQIMSIYIGYENGGFHQLIATHADQYILEKYDAPESTIYIERTIQPEESHQRSQMWRYLDADMKDISFPKSDETTFDPRVRPWYIQAMTNHSCRFTAPYVFSSSRLPGITCAKPLSNGGGVLGVDVALAQLGDMLAHQTITDHGVIWIFDQQNQLIAYPGLDKESSTNEILALPLASKAREPVIQAVTAHRGTSSTLSKEQFYIEAADNTYIVSLTPTPALYGLPLSVAVAAPLHDITGHIDRMTARIVLASAVCLLLMVPAFFFISRCASRSFGALLVQAEKVARFDFSPSPPLHTPIREVQKLATACQSMKNTIQTRTENLTQTQAKLELLVREGVALSAEKDLKTLVSLIFKTAQELTQADGGALYLFENDELGVEMLSLGSESIVLGGLSEHPAPRVMIKPMIMPFLSSDSVLRSACEAYNTRKMLTVHDTALSLFPTGLPEEPSGYPIRSLISAPIVTRRDEVLGVIQLYNPACLAEKDDCSEVAGFIESLTAQAAVTLDNRNLVNSLRDVFDALIQVLATSIDAKSPYTAGHCSRVPIIAEMLAQAAHETTEGPLNNFRLDSADGRRQLWIASWLHDCGKVTTPEYVVDKATKLETIYNRVHEIRLRFEILRRDAEIAHLKRIAINKSDQRESAHTLKKTIQKLEDDFAFVANCNIGGEFLSEAHMERIKDIGKQTWLRHFSDRLGISQEELRSKGDTPEPQLPVTEQLLCDKSEHLVPRHKKYTHIKDASGHPVKTPKYDYNRGEIYNICIQRGTLTQEERFKINEHTLSGLEMLQQIPFPSNLSRVVEIAMEHHETLNGTGYPLRKKKEKLSTESRILAIADIFEALTASDRPYKHPKRLSEALRIMGIMRNDQQIDADLFDIFLRTGVYRDYAEKHLTPEQNDAVNIEDFLSTQN